jgi:Tfp pilus assembly protein PilW
MTRLSGESGVTLIEMLVACVISIAVFGTVLDALNIFQTNNRYDQLRNEAQDSASCAT